MFTWSNLALLARVAPTVCAEKPHCGKSGVPFMYSTTGAADSWLLIRSIAVMVDLQSRHRASPPARACDLASLYDNGPRRSHARPAWREFVELWGRPSYSSSPQAANRAAAPQLRH